MNGGAARDAALAVVRKQGWHVFRLRIGHDDAQCDGGTASCKRLAFVDRHWSEASRADPQIVAAWDWSEVNAYGIDCGKSGLLVADEDPGATWPFNGTRVHGTGRGRHHIYTDLIGYGNRAGVAPWRIDVRGVGGFIIGPGSWHPHGAYEALNDDGLASPPPELIEALRRPSSASERVSGGDARAPLDPLDALGRLEGVYRAMAGAPDGQRNDTLNVMAGAAAGLWVRVPEAERTGELSEEAIKARLLDAVPHDGDPVKSRGTIESGWTYGIKHPVDDRDPALVAAEVTGGLFQRTERLRMIQQAAHSRGIKAPLVLAYCLARVMLEVPHDVVLPPVVGAAASVNLGLIVVGQSSAGKSAASDIAGELLGLNEMQSGLISDLGSGEGMVDQYLDYGVKGMGASPPVIADPRRMFAVDEIEATTKVFERNGSTLGPMLRKALTGGDLSTANAKAGGRNRHVPKGSYRFVLLMCAQPALVRPVLNEHDGGLPQRFCWVDGDDPSFPETVDDYPGWPGSLGWGGGADFAPKTVEYPEAVKRAVRQIHHAAQTGESDLGQQNLVRLKVAYALAVLHDEYEITDLWWELAGQMMRASDATIRQCRAALSEREAEADEAQGRKQGARAVAQAEVVETATSIQKGATKNICRAAQEAGGEGVIWGKVVPRLSQKQRGVAEQMLTRLEAEGLIEVTEVDGGQTGQKGRLIKWVE